MSITIRTVSPLVLAALALPLPGQQRTVVPITNSNEVHNDAKISPDGARVAFLGPGKLGLVPYGGGTEITLFSSNLLGGSYLWAPDSSGLYFFDGTALRFVAAVGGPPRTVANLQGGAHRLWAITSDGVTVYGSRQDTVTRNFTLFTVDTGSGAFADIVTSAATVDGVALNASETKIAFRLYSPQPFQPRDYWVADRDGSNASLLIGAVDLNPEPPVWDGDAAILFWRVDPTQATFVISRVPVATGALVNLTGRPGTARRATRSPDGRWIMFETAANQKRFPALIPPAGGGVVLLDNTRDIAFSGDPTMSDTGGRVVFSGAIQNVPPAQALKVELDRELRVSPRAVTGTTPQLELPVASGEAAAVFLSDSLSGQVFGFPGFTYGVALNPALLILVLSGTGTGQGPLTGPLPIPGDPALVGLSVYLQGLRVVNLSQGDFTRPVELRLF